MKVFLFGPVLARFHFWVDLGPFSFWAGSDQSHLKKIYLFEKFVILSHIFLSILINIGLYFYTIKIRIRY